LVYEFGQSNNSDRADKCFEEEDWLEIFSDCVVYPLLDVSHPTFDANGVRRRHNGWAVWKKGKGKSTITNKPSIIEPFRKPKWSWHCNNLPASIISNSGG
jgi:hypothetical protein